MHPASFDPPAIVPGVVTNDADGLTAMACITMSWLITGDAPSPERYATMACCWVLVVPT